VSVVNSLVIKVYCKAKQLLNPLMRNGWRHVKGHMGNYLLHCGCKLVPSEHLWHSASSVALPLGSWALKGAHGGAHSPA